MSVQSKTIFDLLTILKFFDFTRNWYTSMCNISIDLAHDCFMENAKNKICELVQIELKRIELYVVSCSSFYD